MLAPPELRAIHPLGKSPVITDDGLTIAESGAIIEYLVERYGQGRFAPPPGTPERLRYTYWLHYAEGSAMPPLLLKLVALRIGSAPMPFFVKPIAREIAQTMQEQLHRSATEAAPRLSSKANWRKSDWFVGNEFSAADVQMSFPARSRAAARRRGADCRRS